MENFELLILQRNKRLSCIIQHGRFPFNQNVEFELSATSNSEWNSTLKNFQKQDNLAWYTQIFQNVLQKVFFPFNFAPEFSELSVEWFAFQKFNGSRTFWKLSREISAPSPFATVSKFSEVKVKWKPPQTFLLSKYVGIDWSKKLSRDRKQLMKAAKTSARGRVINNETQWIYGHTIIYIQLIQNALRSILHNQQLLPWIHSKDHSIFPRDILTCVHMFPWKSPDGGQKITSVSSRPQPGKSKWILTTRRHAFILQFKCMNPSQFSRLWSHRLQYIVVWVKRFCHLV